MTIFPISPQQFLKSNFRSFDLDKTRFHGHSPLRKPAFTDIRLYENPLFRAFAFTKTRFSGHSPLRNLFLKRGKPAEGLPLRRTIGFRFDFKAQRYYGNTSSRSTYCRKRRRCNKPLYRHCRLHFQVQLQTGYTDILNHNLHSSEVPEPFRKGT